MSATARAAIVALLSVLLVASAAGGALAEPLTVVDDPEAPAVPLFVEEASTGVDHAYEGSWQFFTGGGVAVFDCDDDELPDLYFAGGEAPAGLYRNTSALGGALSFEQFESEVTDLTLVTGAYPVDIDSDAVTDLAVLRRGENVLLRGLGACTFERANEAWGFDGDDDWSTAFSAKWEPGDGFPTMAVGDYLEIVEDGTFPACDDSALFRPNGRTGFGQPEPLSPGLLLAVDALQRLGPLRAAATCASPTTASTTTPGWVRTSSGRSAPVSPPCPTRARRAGSISTSSA